MGAMSVVRAGSARKQILPLLIGALFSLPALAELSDTIHPFVAGGISYDDNLLRIDKDANPGVETSDTYRSAIAGVILERQIGKQLLTGSAKVSKVSFNRYSQLDYTGKDAALDLAWNVAEHWSGNLGGKYSETLGSFSDFHSAERNLRTDKKVYGNANWRFHPSWQVHGGHTKEEFSYDLASQAYNNRTEDTSEAGFDYLAASGSSFGLLARRMKGSYPDTVFGTSVIDNGYVQDSINVNINWNISGVTQVTFVGGHARRRHNASSLRDQSGNNGRLIANWFPRERLNLSAMVWREFGVSEGLLVNSALATGANLAAKWTLSPKLELNGRVQDEKREFTPLAEAGNVSGLTDRTRDASLGVTYTPWRQVTLGLNAFVAQRSGSVAAFTNSYHSKGIAFNASVKF